VVRADETTTRQAGSDQRGSGLVHEPQAADRPFFLAKLPLLMEAMRSGLQVEASHGGAASFHKSVPNDSFEVDGVRVLRSGMVFS
jgi:hypothetical protein